MCLEQNEVTSITSTEVILNKHEVTSKACMYGLPVGTWRTEQLCPLAQQAKLTTQQFFGFRQVFPEAQGCFSGKRKTPRITPSALWTAFALNW